jgi:D-3-phosphoglycerate dehydrogenase
MRKALVVSRSFGRAVQIGDEILKEGGFEVQRVEPELRPLHEDKMVEIVARENPDVILCGAEPITRDVMAASQRLRMIMKHGVGVDNIDLDAATSQKIVVANTPGTNSEAVADMTIALILALLRGLCEASNSTKAGGWHRYIGHELGILTVGVVGTGRIGQQVVRRLQGFECGILAYDVLQNADLASKKAVQYVNLDELLKKSDIVTLHAPLTEQTRNMIGERELAIMKGTAYLVNAARGELIDEGALYEGLKVGVIAGAALDVFATEPPQASPLLQLDNVLATPHIAAYTHEAMDRMDRACAEIILETFRGQRCAHVLNPVVLDTFQP